MVSKYTIYLLSFRFIELLGIVLPSLPDSFTLRFVILFTFFIAHVNKIPSYYMNWKRNILEPLKDGHLEVNSTEKQCSTPDLEI